MAISTATADSRPGISLNFFILVALCVSLGGGLALMKPPPLPLTFLFVLVGWVLSVVVHEFGHAYVGWKAGDHSVSEKGYLSLDPLKYADITTTIVLPVLFLAMGGIGFPGAAVYLREDLMRSRLGRSLSSLAGPLGTLVVFIALVAAIRLTGSTLPEPLLNALSFLAYLQAMGLILNMLPVPGFDGYGVIRAWLPDSIRSALQPAERFAFIAVFGLLFFVDAAGDLLFNASALLSYVAGVSLDNAQAGLDAFRFWKSS